MVHHSGRVKKGVESGSSRDLRGVSLGVERHTGTVERVLHQSEGFLVAPALVQLFVGIFHVDFHHSRELGDGSVTRKEGCH